MSLLPILGISLAVAIAAMAVLWLVSLAKKDASIVDIFWGTGFVVQAAVYFALTDGYLPRRALVAALVSIWGLRLSLHILRRNWGRAEDPRYRAWRAQWGGQYWWVSFFQVFMLQGVLLWLIATPLLAAQLSAEPSRLTVFDGLGALCWGIGLFFEAVGDWQLARFKADPANRGKVMNRGLWAYTRHPNYFGDAMVWWGYFIIALGTPGGFWTIYSPVIMTTLLLRVSGVALLEKSLESRPGFREYAESTPAFVPWLPKRRG